MSKARLVITAVITEKRPVSEVARDYGVARSWVCTLLARYRAEGGGVRAAVPASEDLTGRDQRDHRRVDRAAAQGTGRARAGRWAAHHRLASGPPPSHSGLSRDHQPVPDPSRPGHPGAEETAQIVLPP